MNEPVKKGVCEGCRAKSYLTCFCCSYMLEGIACEENMSALTEPIDFAAPEPIGDTV